MESRDFTSSGLGAGTRAERSWAEDCCLAASLFEAFTVSDFGVEDDDCADETRGKGATARNAKEQGFQCVLRFATTPDSSSATNVGSLSQKGRAAIE